MNKPAPEGPLRCVTTPDVSSCPRAELYARWRQSCAETAPESLARIWPGTTTNYADEDIRKADLNREMARWCWQVNRGEHGHRRCAGRGRRRSGDPSRTERWRPQPLLRKPLVDGRWGAIVTEPARLCDEHGRDAGMRVQLGPLLRPENIRAGSVARAMPVLATGDTDDEISEVINRLPQRRSDQPIIMGRPTPEGKTTPQHGLPGGTQMTIRSKTWAADL